MVKEGQIWFHVIENYLAWLQHPSASLGHAYLHSHRKPCARVVRFLAFCPTHTMHHVRINHVSRILCCLEECSTNVLFPERLTFVSENLQVSRKATWCRGVTDTVMCTDDDGCNEWTEHMCFEEYSYDEMLTYWCDDVYDSEETCMWGCDNFIPCNAVNFHHDSKKCCFMRTPDRETGPQPKATTKNCASAFVCD